MTSQGSKSQDSALHYKVFALGEEDAPRLAARVRAIASRLEGGARADEDGLGARAVHAAATSPCRLATAWATEAQLLDQLTRAASFLETGRGGRLLPGRGVFVETEGSRPGRVAMLFPGQGAQSVGMMRELSERYPVVSETFDEVDEVLAPDLGRPLTDIIFGRDMEESLADAALTHTAVAQPAILACDIAMLRLLAQHGVEPDLVAGHSLGEYAAAVAAGVLDSRDAFRAVRHRGLAMSQATPEGTDPGLMAAVGAPLDQTLALLEGVEGYVIPANKNCHLQTIVAGSSAAVESAMGRFDEEGIRNTLLRVSHAFHTAIVEPAAESLAQHLAGLELRAPRIPVLANVTGAEYPMGDDAPREIVQLLARQVASPVEFIATVERMYELGARTFIEVGPERTLTSFVGNILGARPHTVRATNIRRKGDHRSFVEALASLVAGGCEPMLDLDQGR